ncbi:hypothetical protein F2Q68_00025590 [Brassica cretica]|uniref:Uncharacterized protein n=2 Tax=Brassica cretica TaxID=69181 RepID=A0A8S9II32_BRACR|nr:hypothetical protein F2Q68_00025590 [Brassica cretica]KAF3576218.1 hypothetical protein DY000_02031447 [Brassica cretica]
MDFPPCSPPPPPSIPVSCQNLTLQNLRIHPHLPLDLPLPTDRLPPSKFSPSANLISLKELRSRT